MCGINGTVAVDLPSGAEVSIKEMNQALAHRGPDADGVWVGDQIALGHRRLSIIDLSESGNQPMHCSGNRYVIVYNGELYNYKELRLELQRVSHGSVEKPYVFKTSTDTEVILAAFGRWGADCLKRMNGMYSFAIWDTKEQRLFVARDRMGIKPFYYHYEQNQLTFSSELKALLQSGYVNKKINQEALVDYLRYQTVHAPNTIIQNVYMLMPGHFGVWEKGKFQISRYWDIKEDIDYSSKGKSYKEVCDEVKTFFLKAVERRLVADVPFGAFLSGGIDSSIVVAAMSKVSGIAVKTFSIVFDEQEYSEAQYARMVAKQYHTEHHELLLKPEDFLYDLPDALLALDHPSGDGTNTFTVSRATKKAGVSMALSGLGGDELFCGYDTFKRNYELEKKYWLNYIPRVVRKIGGQVYTRRKKSIASDKIAELLAQPMVNFEHAYPISRQVLTDSQIAGLLNRFQLPANTVFNWVKEINFEDKKRLLTKYSIAEISTYMQNVLLRDTDQMSMASALEVRVPFLDYELVQYVLGIEDKHKYPFTQKKLLTDSLGQLIPKEIIERPKQGFVLPMQAWMKRELKSFCEENLKVLSSFSCFNYPAVEALWNRFMLNDPRITWSRVWILVVLGNWLKKMDVEF